MTDDTLKTCYDCGCDEEYTTITESRGVLICDDCKCGFCEAPQMYCECPRCGMCEDKVPLCNCFDYDRKMPPWAERGHNIPFISGSYSWQKAWPSLKDGNRPNLVESAS